MRYFSELGVTRHQLKGTTVNALFTGLCGCGHDIRMILRHVRFLFCQIIWLIGLLPRFTRGTGRPQALKIAA